MLDLFKRIAQGAHPHFSTSTALSDGAVRQDTYGDALVSETIFMFAGVDEYGALELHVGAISLSAGATPTGAVVVESSNWGPWTVSSTLDIGSYMPHTTVQTTTLTNPTVSIETVSAGELTLRIHAPDFSWRDLGTADMLPHVGGEGHAHVYLSGRKIGRSYDGNFTVAASDLAPYLGKTVSISVSLVDNMHRGYTQSSVTDGSQMGLHARTLVLPAANGESFTAGAEPTYFQFVDGVGADAYLSMLNQAFAALGQQFSRGDIVGTLFLSFLNPTADPTTFITGLVTDGVLQIVNAPSDLSGGADWST